MAYDVTAQGAYSNRSNHILSLYVRQDALDVAGNRRTFAWSLTAVRVSGSMSYSLDAGGWSANIGSNWGGPTYGGSHNLDFRATSSILLGAGTTPWIGADWSGSINLAVVASHSASLFGSATTNTPILYADQIARVPSKPQPPTFSDIQATTAMLHMYHPDSANGSPVTGWLFRILNGHADNTAIDIRTSSPNYGLTDLTPGKTYNIQYAATNGVGDSEMSDIRQLKMKSGAYVALSDIFQGTEVRVGVGGEFVLAEIYVPDGTSSYVLAQ